MKIYRNIGLTQEEIDEHFSGPGFLPWQRMGNIRGVGGSLSNDFMTEQLKLQKQIIKAERDLGMTVAIPGFSGHVPVAMKRIYSNLTFVSVHWIFNHFAEQYCCALFIEPAEELFHRISEKFITELIKEYGTDHLYFSDPYLDMNPSRSDIDYIFNISLNIHKAMSRVDPAAIWLLPGWVFVENPFWTNNMMKAFLTAVPQGKILVLDLYSEVHPIYERTKSYYGQPFIWCMLHNFGGTLGMHGSIDIVNTRIKLALNMEKSTMIGVGINPEGINQNYAVYEFAFERGWMNESVNINDWFEKFSNVRYGIVDENLIQSWKIIRNTVYAYKNTFKFGGSYIIVLSPHLNMTPSVWYDPTQIKDVMHFLLSANTSLYDNPQYQHDVVDLTRQFLQVIGKWLEDAKGLATNDLDKEIFEFNARNQITLWGPNGELGDYAAKQWSGVVKDYFMPRWELFLIELKRSLKYNKNFNYNEFKNKVFKNNEKPFSLVRKTYPVRSIGNSIKIALKIYSYWTKQINCKNITIDNIPRSIVNAIFM